MPSDDGDCDPRLAKALRRHGSAPGDAARAEVLAALVDARVLAALSAVATGHHVAASGLPAESGAELSLMLLQADDGSRALPVFSDLAELRRWRIDARPVPLTGAQACATALDEGAEALLVDPQGSRVVLDAAETAALAQGWVPVPGSNLSSRTTTTPVATAPAAAPPELVGALRAALQGEGLRAARLLAGDTGLVLGVAPRRPLDAPALAGLAQRIVQRLGPALPREGLDLVVVPTRGPGTPVLRRRFGR